MYKHIKYSFRSTLNDARAHTHTQVPKYVRNTKVLNYENIRIIYSLTVIP